MVIRLRGTIDHWDPAFLEILSAERDVIVFDNRGINASSGTAGSSISEIADGLVEFLDALKLSQVDLFGWSMGGMVAATTTLDHPERVRRLVFSGSTPGTIDGQPMASATVWQIAGREENDDNDFLYLFFPQTPEAKALGIASLRRLDVRLEASGAAVSPEATRSSIDAIRSFGAGVFDRLSEISGPVLIEAGAHDVMAPPHSSLQYAYVLRSGKVVVYSDAGHGFLFQHYEDYGREVLTFLAA
ncbi:alpha/beta fold hydrolase [Curtobacterium flaccumfaciens pv. flaccumfaciens]|uniref:alpha/beta fold hydrolase n=1 Tax=Curtobacterium flaccumfaciens TaxID=2035 RepID=UPI003A4D5979